MESQKSTFETDRTTVGVLQPGFGSGVVIEGGKEVIIPRGRIIKENTRGTVSRVLQQFSEKEGILGEIIRTFGGETEVKEWEQAPECTFCAMICNGSCDEAIEI